MVDDDAEAELRLGGSRKGRGEFTSWIFTIGNEMERNQSKKRGKRFGKEPIKGLNIYLAVQNGYNPVSPCKKNLVRSLY